MAIKSLHQHTVLLFNFMLNLSIHRDNHRNGDESGVLCFSKDFKRKLIMAPRVGYLQGQLAISLLIKKVEDDDVIYYEYHQL